MSSVDMNQHKFIVREKENKSNKLNGFQPDQLSSLVSDFSSENIFP